MTQIPPYLGSKDGTHVSYMPPKLSSIPTNGTVAHFDKSLSLRGKFDVANHSRQMNPGQQSLKATQNQEPMDSDYRERNIEGRRRL